MPNIDESMIHQLINELVVAWNRGDTKAYGARFLDDATFTNVNGMFHDSREEFDQRHDEIFRGPMKGTTLTLTPRKVRFIRPDVAIVDIDCGVFGSTLRPPGVQAGADGALHTCLMLVLAKEGGTWWIAAYHNVWRATMRYDTTGKSEQSKESNFAR
ncbi:MAG: SgcJ/EcaC family oxidoreductase [Candidatus Acidiferrales bacterium]